MIIQTLPPTVLRRLKLIADKTREWDGKEQTMPKEQREEFAMMVASTFQNFRDFAFIGMKVLGYPITEMQADIADYMASREFGKKKMVQAQRGEAKSTLAALYAVWSLIQDPDTKVLIVSGGEKQASDVALLIIRVIQTWHVLCWLRPDTSRGDKTSFEHYDIHCDLRRISKSASVACVGVTANLQGKRADLLIPDDIETTKNSMTQVMRDHLLMLSKDFAAINTHGETLYLGTPQTKDSIYKTLPGRGFHVRIWPGRFPNAEELPRYTPGTLAPLILDKLEEDPTLGTGCGIDGTRGAPTDLGRYTEDALLDKELDFGPEGFSLQYMLDTTLTDALRTRIRLSDFIVGDYSHEGAPERLWWSSEPRCVLNDLPENAQPYTLYKAASTSAEYMDFQHKVAVIDPAGNGGDEVAFCVMGATNSYIHLITVGGLRGGLSEENMDTLLDIFQECGVTDIKVEANMGHGVVSALLAGHCVKRDLKGFGFEDFYAKGQKERRIIDTISPLTRRHKFVIHRRAIEDDHKYSQAHPRDKRTVTSVLHQLANITYDRGSLSMDDRADCIQAGTAALVGLIAVDDGTEAEKRREESGVAFITNPMDYRGVQVVRGSRDNRMAAFSNRRQRSRPRL